jgi:deoxyribodipyrimidine photo-lyase
VRPLVWLRSDLRLDDNPALFQACRDATRGVIAVFLVCGEQWRAHDWGPARVGFLLRSLRELSVQLKARRVPVLVAHADTFDDAPDVLCDLALRHACDGVYLNREYEVNERRRDRAVSRRFEAAGLDVRAFTDQVIVPPGSIRTGKGGFYRVYSAFRRAWAERVREAGPLAPLGRPRAQDAMPVAPDPVPDAVPGFDDPTAARPWPAGAREAKRRLGGFVRTRLDDYGSTRDRPAVDGTSTLSPYLAAGCVSARQCLHAALGHDPRALDDFGRGAGVWVNELIWREFYRHVLVGFPRVCMHRPFVEWTDRVRWRRSRRDLEAWKEGRTGVPIVDAAMRQLLSTSWMHNRLRMITASFLCKNLLIDWREGERHFMRHLVDGDLASNNGGWQWCASTGTDAAPYFRVFNPVSQGRKFDPDGVFVKRWVPELADRSSPRLHDPAPDAIADLATTRRRAIEAFRIARGE